MSQFSLADILAAKKRIAGTIHRTPVLTSSTINHLCNKEVYFKCEHLQKTGSFKSRGALNAVKMLIESGKRPVITHSSGNFGQALAWAAQLFSIDCTVVAPDNAPYSKIDAMEGYGAEIVKCPAHERDALSKKLQKENNWELIEPFDDYRVMAGQGTVGVELVEQVPDLDAILVPVGGGGLCSGISTAIATLKPNIKVFCVEPEGKELEKSFIAKTRLWDVNAFPVDTIADGVRVIAVGERNFPQLLSYCEHSVLTVNDNDITNAMKLIYSRLKQAVEPTGAMCFAALLKYPILLSSYKKVGLILSGGNFDWKILQF